jgi:hypothetical protein
MSGQTYRTSERLRGGGASLRPDQCAWTGLTYRPMSNLLPGDWGVATAPFLHTWRATWGLPVESLRKTQAWVAAATGEADRGSDRRAARLGGLGCDDKHR